MYESGKHLELVDKSLNLNNYDSEEVKKVIGIALLCTQASSAMRPAMSEVVLQLISNDLLEHIFMGSSFLGEEGNYPLSSSKTFTSILF